MELEVDEGDEGMEGAAHAHAFAPDSSESAPGQQ
jgi:hypothetical protein